MLSILGLSAQLLIVVPSDTPPPAPTARQRPQAVEVSDWYNRRLTIHRWLSYTSYPLFAFQYVAGQQIWEKDRAPEWARRGHRIGAVAIAGVFTVNTVTGVWNLVESRHVEDGRARRYLHAASMLIADVGLTWAGTVLSEQAKRSNEKRKLHRTVALSSMAIAVSSATLMWFLNR